MWKIVRTLVIAGSPIELITINEDTELTINIGEVGSITKNFGKNYLEINNTVKFSVIIPAHKEEGFIGDCLKSIEAAARHLSEKIFFHKKSIPSTIL